MKESLLEWLACPQCSGGLTLAADQREGGEVVTGVLTCTRCAVPYPVRGGVPRFVVRDVADAQQATADNFGAQWHTFDALEQEYEGQLLDWISPVTPAFVRGAMVLEGGCGKGRHTRWMAEWGAREVIAVDLSEAVDVAYRHVHALPNAHVIQADIYNLPLRPVFDYAFSVGVLHHLPRPEDGFHALVQKIRPGGAISAWVYGREGNGWIVHFVDPVRRGITSKLPTAVLYWLALAPAGLVYAAVRAIYAPLAGRALGRTLPYRDYLTYLARFRFREIHTIVFDHLTAPIAFYIAREDFAGWFRRAGIDPAAIAAHNNNSWRGFGTVIPRD